MSLGRTIRTDEQQRGFLRDAATESRWVDLLPITLVPFVLVAVYALPRETLSGLILDTTAPSPLTAYTAHFVHLDWFHLLGNLTVYFPAVGVAYLLCLLGDRRQLFWITVLTLLVVFPFALSAMQLIFPRERLIFGFSGINAGLVGLAAFALTAYLGTNISRRTDERDAPVVLFAVVGLIALLALPARAFRFEIAGASTVLAVVYLGIVLSRDGIPTAAEIRAATDRPGYFELAGAGVGLLVGYPVVAFQDAVVPQGGVVDVYVHLLGFSLAFIVVFTFVFVRESL